MDAKEVNREAQAPAASGVERTRDQAVYRPDVDILETSNAVMVIADMPGVDQKSVAVTLEDDVLTIEGFLEPRVKDACQLVAQEYGVGNYERSFRMLSDIDASAVEAKVKNGVLRVVLPKSERARKRAIPVAGD